MKTRHTWVAISLNIIIIWTKCFLSFSLAFFVVWLTCLEPGNNLLLLKQRNFPCNTSNILNRMVALNFKLIGNTNNFAFLFSYLLNFFTTVLWRDPSTVSISEIIVWRLIQKNYILWKLKAGHTCNPSLLGGQDMWMAWDQELETNLGQIVRPYL